MKNNIIDKYISNFEFLSTSCSYKRGCADSSWEKYEKERNRIWREWYDAGGKGKLPEMPKETIECAKCKFANLELGRYVGNASSMVISRKREGTIPVPLKGKKQVWIDNVNQKQLEVALKDIDEDIDAFAISGSPSISDFSFLEKYPRLKIVNLWWNNKTEKLWDLSKNPKLKYLNLSDFNHLADLTELQKAKNLVCLRITSENGCLNSLNPISSLNSLECLELFIKVADRNILPLIPLQSLKCFSLRSDVFDIESYAMFEVRRQDVDTNFYNGLYCYSENFKDDDLILFVGKGQRSALFREKEKIEKQKNKFALLKEQYLTTDFIPILKTDLSSSPIDSWRQALADGIELHSENEIGEMETILKNYANRMTACTSKGQAKNHLKSSIKIISDFNDKTDFIETEEREEIFDYLSSFFKERWCDELQEILDSEIDW